MPANNNKTHQQMTVSELQTKLKEYPADMLVYVLGYEGGVNDVAIFEVAPVRRDQNEEWYYGSHEAKHISSDVLDTDVKGLILS